ncbi:hypothetical protein GCK72_023243 [Caenorhabditis remanei]|uniref:Uncharacterized protein n=1 Tax=Caenorhabditis remanei TaxID=31234 RepID=A0A6A5FW17_CAERE|nr:hypothetical protein GCK72_023243 [Caenorhabditis remanei]KAF1746786.1 hypothetical protein GCK72_023243 [Caenorhabditis remanei]
MHRSLSQAYCTEQLLVGNNAACDKFKNRRYSCENPKQDSSGIPLLPLFCTEKQKYYAPVGAAASIMFTDYFSLTLNNTPIAWTEDGVIDDKLREAYFQPREKNLCDAVEFRNTVKPIGWKHHVCEMGGYRNISLIKWLESTTNKNFKKLYRILDTKKHNGLKQGVYRLQVDNVYNPSVINCTKHKMTKYFWILHPSWLGTEQTFLEKTYLLVGLGLLALSCCLVGFQIFLMDRRITFDSDDMF